jgi:hypothetical protein
MSAKHSNVEPLLPTPPCILHEDQFIRDFREMRATVGRIETAISGDEGLGHRGLAPRIAAVELRQDEQQRAYNGIDRKLAKWGGIVTGAVFTLQFLKEKIFK